MEKSAHSELFFFALYWLVVTFPCGIVHNLEMTKLRVVYGRRVGQVLPSYQNRQISALDETADAPQSSLFISVQKILVSLLQIQVVPGWPPFFLRNNAHSENVCSSLGEKRGAARATPPNSPGNNEHSGKVSFIFFHFLSFSFIFFHCFFIFSLFFSYSFFSGAQIFFCLDCLTIYY